MATPPGPSPSMTAAAVPPRLGRWEAAAGWVFGVMAAGIGLGGFVVSFATINEAMQPSLGGLAWVVPVVIDISIVAFTAIDLLHARLGMRSRLLRFVPLAFIAMTGYLNVAHAWSSGDVEGAVGHGAAPFAWSIAIEVAAHTVRRWAGITQNTASPGAWWRSREMDRVRLNRWFWAPVQTLRLRRRMSLLEQRSYTEAVAADLQWRLARAELRDHYGPRWRRQAPARLVVLLRQGALVPAHITEHPVEDAPVLSGAAARDDVETGEDREAPRAGQDPVAQLQTAGHRLGQRSAAGRRRRPDRTGRPGPSGDSRGRRLSDLPDDEQLQLGLQAARELSGQGRTLSGPALSEVLRRWGYQLSNELRSTLARKVKAVLDDTPDTPDDDPRDGAGASGQLSNAGSPSTDTGATSRGAGSAEPTVAVT